jgi:hypothetical protein
VRRVAPHAQRGIARHQRIGDLAADLGGRARYRPMVSELRIRKI